MLKTDLEIKEIAPRKHALAKRDVPQGIYPTRNLALIAAHEIAVGTLPEGHPEIKKYKMEIERLKR